MRRLSSFVLLASAWLLLGGAGFLEAMPEEESPRDVHYTPAPPAPRAQLPEEAAAKSAGCRSCHTTTDSLTMHESDLVTLGCTDCHGGDAQVMGPRQGASGTPAYDEAMNRAHVLPRYPQSWGYPKSRKPQESYTLLNREAPEFIRFVNPSDLRVAREACGACHLPIIEAAERSLMASGAMLWGGASYNNGILPYKNYVLGEAYMRDGTAAIAKNPKEPDALMKSHGILPKLLPLPAWEVTPPADIFRVFERGGISIGSQFPDIGNPDAEGKLQVLEMPGKPDIHQSNRGLGTGLRIAVPVLNITKTRLNDPFTWFLGTNDNPGDYRTSGCGACHVVYANDRDPRHASVYAVFGHNGESASTDPTIPKHEPGHPIHHSFTRAIPTSQCMICHMHQPNMFLNTMLGYTMWDYEADAPFMWPAKQKYPSDAEARSILDRNPEEASIRGKWGDPAFLDHVSELNPNLKITQFADYHGHGWNFRAIFKQDRKGDLLDAKGKIVSRDDPEWAKKAVHLSSIHVDKGMQCVDCHFSQDAHGNGYIYGEVMSAIEIRCVDCHGTIERYPTLMTSGPAARPGGYDLALLRNQDGRRRFEWRGNKLIQHSAVDPKLEWEVSLVKDTVDPTNPRFNPRAARAKLIAKGTTFKWGPGVPEADLAHKDSEMACFTCHTSWTTSCGGCHLPIQANWRTERHHFEGGFTRNFATYNPQVARDEMFQLGRHSTVKGNIIAPVRSSSALVLSSTNINRDRIYIQQPPISASGYSSQAFAPHYPHTERTTETKTCTDCHLSQANDNNAIMAQLLLLGTNFVNFIGYNSWVGEDGGIEAVRVTEWDEPQAVIGSYLHKYAYPDWYNAHVARGRKLEEAHGHSGGRSGCIQERGEFVYVAEGDDGMRAYDVASVANKDVSERIITAPFSPLGQDMHIGSRNATCVALPTNQSIDPARNQGKLMREDNQEQPMHPIYNYAYITDAEEGLILTNVNPLSSREPRSRFLERALTWNEGGVLKGARHITIGGDHFYIAADAGVVVLDMSDPLHPKLDTVVKLDGARATALQFRYLFALDREGLQVIDVTHPEAPQLVAGAAVPLADARRLYVARTYAYVADGRDGLAIIDVERPEHPRLAQIFNADGKMNDANDVVVGTTNASLFAYVADGNNGLKVIQLTSPDSQPNLYGFSPEPKPELIAWRKTEWPALSLSKGLDRDRAVDESGNQIAILGRLGSRPFTLPEMQALYLDQKGVPWFVTDDVRMEDLLRALPPPPPPARSGPSKPVSGKEPFSGPPRQ